MWCVSQNEDEKTSIKLEKKDKRGKDRTEDNNLTESRVKNLEQEKAM